MPSVAKVDNEEKAPALQRAVSSLWGVGGERATQLARLGIATIEDLLLHRPRRYEDRRHFRPVAELQMGEPALTRGSAVAMGVNRYRKGSKSVFELILDDGTARLHCRWWNLPFMEKYFEVGDEVVVYGKPLSLRPRTMDHPETEVVEAGEERFLHFNRIVPIYPLTEGLPQRWLRGLIWRALGQFERYIADPWPGSSPGDIGSGRSSISADRKAGIAENVPHFPSRAKAIHDLHFPESDGDADIARRRLALDEFVALQTQLQKRRRTFESRARALPCAGDNHLMKPFLNRLGFKLTEAQTNVLREIRKDMGGPHPMRRLLQGDVGSGKTVVATCTALMALESGFNVALMAPTEILAEQHWTRFRQWLEPLGVRIILQTGSRKTGKGGGWKVEDSGDQPRASHHHRPALLVGTHALLENTVAIERLGLVVIDEQHRFGVTQREQLVRKGRYPHLLVMTATPIPRTLGLTLYGDLDVSVIDELPGGRGQLKTFIRTTNSLPKVWEFVRRKIEEGRQAYVVYPRVEETDTGTVKAVTKEYENLRKTLAPFQVGLLHGRLNSKDREAVMTGFRENRVRVLLATSLVEVGVDVPNATIMLIENAEAFGLAQLHQLRGRIGRGAHDSHCILISDVRNPESRQRLRILAETSDGFRIAEEDLKLRGPGELLGQQQSGVPRFRFGNLAEDLDLIRLARKIAANMAL